MMNGKNSRSRKTIDELLDGRHLRRLKAEDRYHARITKREDAAEAMIGTLIREGQEVCYVWPQGGRYREGTRFDLTQFLIRNNYA